MSNDRLQPLKIQGPRVDAKMLEIRGPDGQFLVSLDYDGSAEFGEDYTPEEAARRFWQSMAGLVGLEKVCAAHGYKLVKEEG